MVTRMMPIYGNQDDHLFSMYCTTNAKGKLGGMEADFLSEGEKDIRMKK